MVQVQHNLVLVSFTLQGMAWIFLFNHYFSLDASSKKIVCCHCIMGTIQIGAQTF